MNALTHPLAIIFFTLCAVIFSLSMYHGQNHNPDYLEQLSLLEQKNNQLQTQKEILAFKKELSEKQIMQEKIIRDELWQQKPGETVFDLADFKVTAPPALPTAENKKVSPWKQWQTLLEL